MAMAHYLPKSSVAVLENGHLIRVLVATISSGVASLTLLAWGTIGLERLI